MRQVSNVPTPAPSSSERARTPVPAASRPQRVAPVQRPVAPAPIHPFRTTRLPLPPPPTRTPRNTRTAHSPRNSGKSIVPLLSTSTSLTMSSSSSGVGFCPSERRNDPISCAEMVPSPSAKGQVGCRASACTSGPTGVSLLLLRGAPSPRGVPVECSRLTGAVIRGSWPSQRDAPRKTTTRPATSSPLSNSENAALKSFICNATAISARRTQRTPGHARQTWASFWRGSELAARTGGKGVQLAKGQSPAPLQNRASALHMCHSQAGPFRESCCRP